MLVSLCRSMKSAVMPSIGVTPARASEAFRRRRDPDEDDDERVLAEDVPEETAGEGLTGLTSPPGCAPGLGDGEHRESDHVARGAGQVVEVAEEPQVLDARELHEEERDQGERQRDVERRGRGLEAGMMPITFIVRM